VALPSTLDLVGLGLALGGALCAWRSCRWLARTAAEGGRDRSGATETRERVSLLVPARNEERNIAVCLASLVAQRGSDVEVLVLDDASSDATAEHARRVLEQSGVRGAVLTGRPLEPGWGGKCFACQQLAEAASGEWLFFLDADVRLEPEAVANALRQVRGVRADFASFLPRYVGSFWGNRLVVPWLYYFLTALIPVPEILRVKHPRLSVAIGQAILVRRDAYFRLGGHAAVKTHVIEDVSLAIAAKTAGLRTALLDGHAWLRCRMYGDLRGLAEGFAKNFHSAAELHPLQWLAMMSLLVLVGLWPWGRLLLPSAGAPPAALATVAIVSATFAALMVRFRQRLVATLTWPAALALLIAISLNAGVRGLLGVPVAWRGRKVGGTTTVAATRRGAVPDE
jgi:chlorobactene glucosyltransferase